MQATEGRTEEKEGGPEKQKERRISSYHHESTSDSRRSKSDGTSCRSDGCSGSSNSGSPESGTCEYQFKQKTQYLEIQYMCKCSHDLKHRALRKHSKRSWNCEGRG